ncbi:hypothetical protein ACFJIX_05915 [Roseateles sp. UC29_93]|uniref:hypothetical protein n=1 Tax=Roseateles sp. UC29_93 TaxID=3350177 RepID=UPI00366BC9DB
MAKEKENDGSADAAVTMNLSTFVIAQGALVKHASGVFRVDEVLGLESVFARNLDTGRPEVLRVAELEAIGSQIPPASTQAVEGIPEPDWAEARARYEIIRPLLESGTPTRVLSIAK